MTEPYFKHYNDKAIFLMNKASIHKKQSYYLSFTAMGEIISIIENKFKYSSVFKYSSRSYFLNHVQKHPKQYGHLDLKGFEDAAEIAKKFIILK